jgi:hypothetical protein
MWVESTESFSNGNCVEAKFVPAQPCLQGSCEPSHVHQDMVHVRDSKDPDGPVLKFTIAEWAAFLDGANQGEFDPYRLRLRGATRESVKLA